MTGAINILEMSKLQMPIKQHRFPEMTHLADDEMLKETKTYETVQTNQIPHNDPKKQNKPLTRIPALLNSPLIIIQVNKSQ